MRTTVYGNIDASTVQSIMCFRNCHLPPSIKRFRLLRILDALASCLESIPDQLFELFHLRFLGFVYKSCTPIPAAIAKLENLQTLIILGPAIIILKRLARSVSTLYNNCFLPQQIWTIQQLRHLVFYGWLPDPEETALENLQTLSIAPCPSYTPGFLKKLPNMKKLRLYCFGYRDYTFLGNLVYLNHLQSLELCQFKREAVLGEYDFTYPRMLKKLTLCGWRLLWDEMNAVGSLRNLQVLKLKQCTCQGSEWETTEGDFPQLELLLIEDLDFEQWITESSHFPMLKTLLLHQCLRLREDPEGIGEIETLEVIEARGGAKVLEDSAKRILEEQQSLGNFALQVRCMPSE